MAIDIKNLLEFAQRDIATVDSTSDTELVLRLFRIANLAGPTLHMYDSTSDLPNLLDETADTAQLAFVKNRRELYVNRGTWVPQTVSSPVLPPSYSFQGSNFGYTSGGLVPPASNVIDKFSFTSDGNATDVGDLTLARNAPAGQSSTTHGYTSGGNNPITNIIDKFSFAVDGNASDVGDLTVARYGGAGQSSQNYGYTSGGANPARSNIIDKFPFASDANASDVGDLTEARVYAAGQNSSSHGYSSGGSNPDLTPGFRLTIDKFSFVVDGNATDVGDLTVARHSVAGQSSTTHGYTSGGFAPPNSNVIDKFPFASDANASDVGDLTAAKNAPAGQSSTVSGYVSGGADPVGRINVIEKFPFSSDANASDVGDLTVIRNAAAGQQY